MDVLRPLGNPSVVVARVALALLVAAIAALSIEIRLSKSDFSLVGQAAGIISFAEMTPSNHHGIRIVYGRYPAAQSASTEIPGRIRSWEMPSILREAWNHLVVDAHPNDVSDAPGIRIEIAVRPFVELYLREFSECVDELRADCLGMQVDDVERIPCVLHDLQPIAGGLDEIRDHLVSVLVECIHDWKWRNQFLRTEVRENQALEFNDGVGAEACPAQDLACRRLARRLKDCAVQTVFPAVVAASDAVAFDNAELERHVSVAAMEMHQAKPASFLPEENKILADDPNSDRQVFDLLSHGDGHPVSAQIFSAGASRPDFGQLRIRVSAPNLLPRVASEIALWNIESCVHFSHQDRVPTNSPKNCFSCGDLQACRRCLDKHSHELHKFRSDVGCDKMNRPVALQAMANPIAGVAIRKASQPLPKSGIGRIKMHMVAADTHAPPAAFALNSNENSFGPSPQAVEAARAACAGIAKYVEGQNEILAPAIAERFGLQRDRIAIGCGSDDLLSRISRAYLGSGSELLRSRNSYLKVPNYAYANDAVPVGASDAEFTTVVDSMLAAVSERTRIVYIANPDNPSGTCIGLDELKRLHRGLPASVVLVLDCAYSEYVDLPGYEAGVMELAKCNSNVIVTRTFSKVYGLAGARVGWAYGSPKIIDALKRIGLTFQLSTPSLAAALAALSDRRHIEFVANETRRLRREYQMKFADLGIKIYPSQANFLLAEFPDSERNAQAAWDELQRNGIAVRRFNSNAYRNCLRITLGTESALLAAEAALGRFLGKG